MNDATETKVTEYALHLNGIFGRNRKSKFEVIALADRPLDAPAPTTEEVQNLVNTAVAKLKVKPGARLQVIATEVTVKVHDGRYTSRSFMMFSGKKVYEAVV